MKVATAVQAAHLPPTASDRGRGRRGGTRRLTGDAVQPDFAAVAAATDCTGWTVRGVVAHVAGACEAAAHFRVLWRHNRIADSRCRHRQWIGAQAGCQLHDRTGRGRRDLVAELAVAGPAGMRFHRRMPALLRRCVDALMAPGIDAALGPALDGGWWAAGLRRPHRFAFFGVPTSTGQTYATQRRRLAGLGLGVAELPALSDVDVWEDALSVSADAAGGRFAATVASVTGSWVAP